MSRDRNAGRGHSVKIDNSYIERVEEFKYLGTTITDQNSIQEEINQSISIRLINQFQLDLLEQGTAKFGRSNGEKKSWLHCILFYIFIVINFNLFYFHI